MIGPNGLDRTIRHYWKGLISGKVLEKTSEIMFPRTREKKPNYDEATRRSAVVTAKRDNLSLDLLSPLSIHHRDLVRQLALFVRSRFIWGT
jgi:hypothetical protein